MYSTHPEAERPHEKVGFLWVSGVRRQKEMQTSVQRNVSSSFQPTFRQPPDYLVGGSTTYEDATVVVARTTFMFLKVSHSYDVSALLFASNPGVDLKNMRTNTVFANTHFIFLLSSAHLKDHLN